MLVSLQGCGWHAAYAPHGSGDPVQRLARIDVALIPERSGQLLREALQGRLQGSGASVPAEDRLTVRYSVSQQGLAINPDSSVTRTRLIGTATYVLSALGGVPRTCAAGTVRQVDGYDIENEQYFASDLEAETVQRRLAEAVADEITARLVLAVGGTAGQDHASGCES